MKTLLLFPVVINLLFLSGCTTPLPNPHVPPSAVESPASDILVVSAVYGSGTKFADVTYRVSELLRQPSVEFFARPEWLRADPTPGWNKALVIIFEHKGRRRIFTSGEGGKVTLERLLDTSRQKAKKK